VDEATPAGGVTRPKNGQDGPTMVRCVGGLERMDGAVLALGISSR
jgi:hypothetical protein